MVNVECTRCVDGKGFINAFKHIKGGVCFKCGGKGFVMQKTKPVKSIKFCAMQKFNENEEFVVTFFFKARNEKDANKKLEKKLANTGRQFFAQQV